MAKCIILESYPPSGQLRQCFTWYSCIRREILVPIKDALWYKEMIASIGSLAIIQQFSVVLGYKKQLLALDG
jgi:hypothetical protein